jgi:ABC-type uncharacterized transport system fused permease/ATPase subunit
VVSLDHGGVAVDPIFETGQTLNSNMLFIYESVVNTFASLGQLLEFLETFANFSGLVTRVGELDEVLAEMDAACMKHAEGAVGDCPIVGIFDQLHRCV